MGGVADDGLKRTGELRTAVRTPEALKPYKPRLKIEGGAGGGRGGCRGGGGRLGGSGGYGCSGGRRRRSGSSFMNSNWYFRLRCCRGHHIKAA